MDYDEESAFVLEDFDLENNQEEGAEENENYEEYQMERGAFERVSRDNNFMTMTNLEGYEQKIYNLSYEEQFLLKLGSLRETFNITSQDIETIKMVVEKVPLIKYKNAYAFLAGYKSIVDREIDRDQIELFAGDIDALILYGTSNYDILRYARLVHKIIYGKK